MKRTTETTLGIIALILQFLVTVLGISIVLIMTIQFPEQLPNFLELWYAWAIMGIHLLGFALGIIALLLIKSNPRKSGILLLFTGVLMLLLTMGATLIQSILFIIIGCMCLARKTKNVNRRLINPV